MTRHPFAPFAAMIMALFLLSAMDALIKLVTDGHQTWQIVVLRYSFGLATIVIFFIAIRLTTRRYTLDINRRSISTSALRAVLIVLTASSFFYALAYLPLAQAVTIAFSAPLFMLLFSRLILKETVTARALFAIALGFSGIVVIFGDALFPLKAPSLAPMIAALMASVFYAMAIVLSRKDTCHTGPMQMVVLQTAFSLCIALPFGLLDLELMNWTPITVSTFTLFLIIGTLGSIGHVLMIWALARETTARLGSIEYSGILWATIFGFALFGDIPGWNTVLGAALVVVGCILAGRTHVPGKIDTVSSHQTIS